MANEQTRLLQSRNMDIVNHDMLALELRLALDKQRSDTNRQAVVLLVCLCLLPVMINVLCLLPVMINFEVQLLLLQAVKEISLSLIDSGVVHMIVFFYSVVQLWPTACTGRGRFGR